MKKKENKSKKYRPPEKNETNIPKKPEVLEESKKDEQKVKKYISPGSKLKKKIIIFGSIGLFLLFVIWRIFIFLSQYRYEEIDRNDIGINEEMFESELDSILNIALLGVDNNNISDAILVASINPIKDPPTVKLISFARDTLVEVFPKNKKTYYTKINEAYGNGGETTTLRTLNKNFNLNVRNYVSIEMAGFAMIVDKLGGIDTEITNDERNQINGVINTTKELKEISKDMVMTSGPVHLNGPQTVAFARIRKVPRADGISDDFGRGERPKEVLMKIFDKVKVTPKTKIFSLIEPSLKFLKTSIKLTEILKICRDFMGRKYSMEHISIPNQEAPLNRDFKIMRFGQETSTVFYDLKYAGKIVNNFIYRDIQPDTFLKENPPPSLNYNKISVVRPNFHKEETNISKNNSNKNNSYNKQSSYKNNQFYKNPKEEIKKDNNTNINFEEKNKKENILKKTEKVLENQQKNKDSYQKENLINKMVKQQPKEKKEENKIKFENLEKNNKGNTSQNNNKQNQKPQNIQAKQNNQNKQVNNLNNSTKFNNNQINKSNQKINKKY